MGAACALHDGQVNAPDPHRAEAWKGAGDTALRQLLPLVSSAGCRWLCFPLLLQFPERGKTQATCEERWVTSTGGHGAPGWTCTLQTACKSYCVPSSRTLMLFPRQVQANLFAPGLRRCPVVPRWLSRPQWEEDSYAANLRKGERVRILRRCPQLGITTGHPWQGQGTLPCDKIHVFSSQQSMGTWATHTCPGSPGPAHPLLQAFSLLGN